MRTTAVSEFLARRRSVLAKDLVEPGPSGEELDRLLEIAARVPDHGRLVPWRFIVFEGAARAEAGRALEAIVKANEPEAGAARLNLERTRLERAPVVVCVASRAAPHPKIPEWEQVLSAGAACQTLLAAALAGGWGAQWLTEWCAYDGAARAALGLAQHERIAGLIYIGTAREAPQERARPVMDEIVTRWNAREDQCSTTD